MHELHEQHFEEHSMLSDGPKYKPMAMMQYLKAEHSMEILNNRWKSFSFLAFLIYAWHFFMAIFAVNVFTDIRQNRQCKDG